MRQGILFVISGPAGSGKGTVVESLCKNHSDVGLSVSMTTRQPRSMDVDGVTYYFTTREDFENRDALIAQLDAVCEKTCISAGEEQIPVSIARGIESFDVDVDITIEEVVNRADKNMYKHKETMKKQVALGGE